MFHGETEYSRQKIWGQVECCNLRARNNPASVVVAERISTAAFCSFPGRAFLQAVNAACDETMESREKTSLDKERAGRTKATARDGSGASVWT